jgi:hypothetical protein
MNPKPRPLANLSQRSQKGLPVFVIENNIPSLVPPSHHMVKSSFKFQSNTSRHAGNPTDNTNARHQRMKDNAH